MKNQPLMAIDSLGRTMSEPMEKSTVKENHLTGLFYFLWLETKDHPIYDVSKITAKDPQAGSHGDDPEWGGVGIYHHWGEPFYGYYTQDDEWVVRKHMKLIIQAGIDFIFFDTTNAVIYEPQLKLVLRILDEYQKDGFKIPKVMCYTNTRSGWTVERIYEAIYKPGYCKDTWFCLGGKPVIIAIADECSEETRNFFNIKKAQWPNEPDKVGGWPWMDFTKPQRVFVDENGNKETINVSVAQHPQLRFGDSVLYGETTNCGRGWHNGANDPDPEGYIHGYNFAEQFDRAIETDPPIVLITGWNEWIAGRWQGIPERPIMFVDCANYEYSRDLEMMRGGYFDNFYMQLCSYVRKYEGIGGAPVTPAGQTAVYDNFGDGLMHRDAKGCCASEPNYKNYTQRNSIRRISVTRDNGKLTFDILAGNTISDDRSGAFMNIFISLGKAPGFDFVIKDGAVYKIRRAPAENSSARKCDILTDTVKAGNADYFVSGNSCKVTVALSDLDLPSDGFEIWFKAADSTEEYVNVEQFYENGDVAPLGRLGFVYRAK